MAMTNLTTCVAQTLICQVCGRVTTQTQDLCAMVTQAHLTGSSYQVETRNYNAINV